VASNPYRAATLSSKARLGQRNCQRTTLQAGINPAEPLPRTQAHQLLGKSPMSTRSTVIRPMIFLTLMASFIIGCATPPAGREPPPAKQLYFALELTQDGHKLGSPQLLGFEGHQVVAEKRSPGAAEPEYRLVLKPQESGAGYKVVLELVLPSGKKLGEVALLHGEERSVQLGDAELKLMLLRVDSPEFRALMALAPNAGRGTI
jgi:hypothetical protein